jgi:outer membrane receptor protein involved in Fe transport
MITVSSHARNALLRTTGIVGVLAVTLSNAALAQSPTYAFDIPAEPLSLALQQMAKTSGKQIIFAENVTGGRSTTGLRGNFTVDDAVGRLLAGTNLDVAKANSGGLIIKSKNVQAAANTNEAAANTSQSSEAASTAAETVVVTGSRVISDIANSPTPITAVSAEQLRTTTPSNIPDALNKLPAFFGSQSARTSSNAGSNAAGNVLNLLNFGVQRTLVLFDGKRVVPSNANGTVDVDTLPQMLMSRVDVVTGGASAVYGSDAVTGVVNFILDKNFEGLKYEANAGTSNQVLGTQFKAGIAAGTDLFGGRGHVEFSAEYFHHDMVPDSAMPYGNNGQAWAETGTGTAANPYTPTQYSRLPTQPFTGVITCSGCAANGMTFISPGVLGPILPGQPTGSGGVTSGGGGGYDLAQTYQSSLRTAEAFGRFSYDLNDETTFYVQGIAAESGSYADWYELNLSPAGPGHPNTFFTNNPFLPAATQALLQRGNTAATFQDSNIVQYIDGASAEAQNDVYATGNVTRNLSITAGFDGTIFNKYKWNFYYTHGESRENEYQPNNTNLQKEYASDDAVLNASGQAVCYVSTTAYANLYPGCVPVNPFGLGTFSQSAYNYMSQRTQFILTNTMDDVGANVVGDVFDLPAGPVTASVSGEAHWLKYNVNSNASPTATVNCTGLRICDPTTPLWLQNTVASVNASENIYEFATEMNIPVLKNLPLVQAFDLDVAGRYANYSESGDAKTWKIGANWRVDDSVRLRGTMSVDIRAPTLNDLFAPLQASIVGLTDILTNQSLPAQTHSQGNPNLVPEVAHTYTTGVVITPSAIPNLTISADYFRVNMAQGIASISGGTAAIQQLCINSGGSSPYCALDVRPFPITNTTPANYPIYTVTENLNSASVRTEGVDLEIDYNFDLADIMDTLPGSVSVRNMATIQPYINTVSYPGAATTFTPMPKGRDTGFVSYSVGSWSLNLQNTWLSGYSQASLATQVYTNPRVHSYDALDVTINKAFDVEGGEMNLYLTVQDIANTLLPLVPNGANPGLTYPTPVAEGGSLGRFFTIGIRGNL